MTYHKNTVSTPLQRKAETEIDGHLLKAGDPVKVLTLPDNPGRFMRGTWTFRALVTNQTGHFWFDVHGGKPGREMTRAFAPERIVPIKQRQRKSTTIN